MGGGGEITRFVCGYLVCDPQLSKAFWGGLPPIFKVNIGNDSSGQWLENSIRYSVGQAVASQTESEIVVAKLSEALFAETLRRYVDILPPGQTGWLAGARDPDVGNALALVHRQPSDPWTIAELARRVGVSRSVLAERFRHFLGVPPMAYLTRWRLQLGAQLLTSTSHSVAQISAGWLRIRAGVQPRLQARIWLTARALSYEIQSRRYPLKPGRAEQRPETLAFRHRAPKTT